MKRFGVGACLALGMLSAMNLAWAQDDFAQVDTPSPEGVRPLHRGFYVAPMASYVMPHSGRGMSDGLGGILGLGYRYGVLSVELSGEYAELDADEGESSGELTAAHAGLVWFPLMESRSAARGLFALAAVGSLKTKDQPVGNLSFTNGSFEAGAGYLLPISFGSYEFALRAEGRARFSERGRDIAFGDDNLPRRYQDVMFNLGLQLPFGLKKEPPAPPPVQIVAPVLICSDGIDNDGDGKTDFPSDPGCTAADDGDETDPPACSDGLDNDGDGLIDFPDDKGCSAPDDGDETDPCKVPAAGERVSLKGCGTGDIIVLRGVNFEYDKSRLTVNARTILDNVAEELIAYPTINVEISGHTDSRGSDEYNQGLSEKRSASVVAYLASRGVHAGRMSAAGYGESQPVADNETDEERELNRRVELKITSQSDPTPSVNESLPVEADAESANESPPSEPNTEATPPSASP